MYRSHQGWYRLVNPQKYKKPLDEHMQSSKDGFVKYKSSLELSAFRYADFNKYVTMWSLEPFAIPYVKPTDNKVHRYYVDLVLNFKDAIVLVEVKDSSETHPPKIPRRKTPTSMSNYNNALQTWYINQAKWKAATEYCKKKGFHFCILTEKLLK